MPTTFKVIYIGQLADIDTQEGSGGVDPDRVTSWLGTYGSAADPLFKQIHTLTPVIFTGNGGVSYEINSNLSQDKYKIDGGEDRLFDAAMVFEARITYSDGTISPSVNVGLFQDKDGNVYLPPPHRDAPASLQTALGLKPIQSLELLSPKYGPNAKNHGWNLYADLLDNTFAVCFSADTMIETDRGHRRILDLKPGDMVRTADNGMQPVRWLYSRKITAERLIDAPKLRPIRIRAGALGKGRPISDLVVSPQHRILINSKIARRMFSLDGVLVSAKKLLEIEGVEVAEDLQEMIYVHILFDRHEIIFANGIETESLFTGPQALKMMPPEAIEEIYAIFPELREPDLADCLIPARMVPSGRSVRNLLLRHIKNRQDLVVK